MDTVIITSGEYSGQTGTLIKEYDGTLYIELDETGEQIQANNQEWDYRN